MTNFGFFQLTEKIVEDQCDEVYWMDDILDFLDGKQELYSNFWHQLHPKKLYRLWMCL
jgi:hypothetical protein